MDTGSMFGFMDIIVLGCGVYGIYSWYMLVKKQEIKKAFLLGGDSRVEESTDFQGFADCIGSKLLIVSIAMIVFGAVSAVNDYVQSLGAVIWIALVGFFGILVWYCVQLRKANQMYFKKGASTGSTIKNKALNKK